MSFQRLAGTFCRSIQYASRQHCSLPLRVSEVGNPSRSLLNNLGNKFSPVQPFGAPAFVRRMTTEEKEKKVYSAAELATFAASAVIFMIGASYAAVPLYRVFCAATGYGGTVRIAANVEDKIKKRMDNPDPKLEAAAAKRELRVWFNGDVTQDMPWRFVPTQQFITVKPGESTLAFFTATNMSDKPITGYSLYNVTPDKAAYYFNKIQCFCFEEQRLRGNETIDMPVFFYIDPEFATDWHCRNIDDITLSYTFHRVEDMEEEDEMRVDDGAPTQVKLHGAEIPESAYAKYAATTGQPINSTGVPVIAISSANAVPGKPASVQSAEAKADAK